MNNTLKTFVILFVSIVCVFCVFFFSEKYMPKFITKYKDKLVKFLESFDFEEKPKKFVSKGERICCETMSNYFKKEFVSVRPEWLKNHTGRSLELDCYNDELKIAVEYNGIQHYKWPNFTKQSYQQFADQVARDKRKKYLCELNNVRLITVPYTIQHCDIPQFLLNNISL